MEKFHCRQKLVKTLISYFLKIDQEITEEISLFSTSITVNFLSEEGISDKESIRRISSATIGGLVRLVTGTAEIAAKAACGQIPDTANGQSAGKLLAETVPSWTKLLGESEELFFKSPAGQNLARELYETHPALIGPVKKLSYIVYKMYEEEMQTNKIDLYFQKNY